MLFSERNNYKEAQTTLIKNEMPSVVATAISNVFTDLEKVFDSMCRGTNYDFDELEKYIYTKVLNQDIRTIGLFKRDGIIYCCFQENRMEWYKKLDLIEVILHQLRQHLNKNGQHAIDLMIDELNREFHRLCYGYRIVNDYVVEITSEEEIQEVKNALEHTEDAVATHIQQALVLQNKRPNPDYRNSIKESISAVEALCRKYYGGDTLGAAINNMRKNKTAIHSMLISSLGKIYDYTNQSDTGIRHSFVNP